MYQQQRRPLASDYRVEVQLTDIDVTAGKRVGELGREFLLPASLVRPIELTAGPVKKAKSAVTKAKEMARAWRLDQTGERSQDQVHALAAGLD